MAVDESAPVCSDFARIGYCEKGIRCNGKHVFECPDYSHTGKCMLPNCRLPHIDRAAQLRQRDLAKLPDQHDDSTLPPETGYEEAANDNVHETRFLGSAVDSSDLDADFIPLGKY